MKKLILIFSLFLSLGAYAQDVEIALSKPLTGRTRQNFIHYNPDTKTLKCLDVETPVSKIVWKPDIKVYSFYYRVTIEGKPYDKLLCNMYPSRWKFSTYYPTDSDWLDDVIKPVEAH